MKEKLNVLSLFDGKSCGQVSLKSLGFNIENYYASEIEKESIIVTQYHHPNTIQVGDVRHLKGSDFPNVNLIIGGSPCQSFSMMGKRKGMLTKSNIVVDSLEIYLKLKGDEFKFEGQSYLYWELVRLYTEIKNIRGDKPTYFFLENVKMNKEWEHIVTNGLGVVPLHINSSLVIPQNRNRFYWTNLPGVTIPEDLRMTLDMIIPDAVTGSGIRGRKKKPETFYRYYRTNRKGNIANTVLTYFGNKGYGTCHILLKDGTYRPITIEEAELLQGLESGYTNVEGICMTHRKKMIGNGWTIPVIKHLFKSLKNIDTIVV